MRVIPASAIPVQWRAAEDISDDHKDTAEPGVITINVDYMGIPSPWVEMVVGDRIAAFQLHDLFQALADQYERDNDE